jgi:hypothetical protein
MDWTIEYFCRKDFEEYQRRRQAVGKESMVHL